MRAPLPSCSASSSLTSRLASSFAGLTTARVALKEINTGGGLSRRGGGQVRRGGPTEAGRHVTWALQLFPNTPIWEV